LGLKVVLFIKGPWLLFFNLGFLSLSFFSFFNLFFNLWNKVLGESVYVNVFFSDVDFRAILGSLGLGDVTGLLVHLPLDDWATLGVEVIAEDANHALLGVKVQGNALWCVFESSTPDLATLAINTERVNEISKLLLDGELLPVFLLGLLELVQLLLESVLLGLFRFLGFFGLILAEFLPLFIDGHLLSKEFFLSLGELLLHLFDVIDSDIVGDFFDGVL